MSEPSDRELREMSREQLVELGGELDDVAIASKTDNWPTRGTKPEKRAERAVAAWFVVSGLLALAFVLVYILWPDRYVVPGQDGYVRYSWYTPLLGFTFGFSVLALSIGVIAYQKNFYPDEVAVQQRHDGPASEVQRVTATARFAEAGEDTGLGRRKLLRRVLLGAGAIFGVTAGTLAIGPFVRDPWQGGDNAALWVTGWKSFNEETVYLRIDTGVLGEIVRVRPEDIVPGSMMTVYPFRESDRGDKELLLAAERASDSPVMLIRFRPGTAITHRPGQEDFHYGQYYAFSKICTHLGCPASLYDTQNNISICACHYSAFAMNEGARVVFGPASRPLPQLPITVDEEGYLIARRDFVEPVGPTFWEWRAG